MPDTPTGFRGYHGQASSVLVRIDPTGVAAWSSEQPFNILFPANRPVSELMVEALHEIGVHPTSFVDPATNQPKYKFMVDNTNGVGEPNDTVVDMSNTLMDIHSAWTSTVRTALGSNQPEPSQELIPVLKIVSV